MAYLLDVIVLVLFAFTVFLGFKNGFIKAMIGVLSFALALLFTSMLAPPTADLVYEKFIEPEVISSFGAYADDEDLTGEQVKEAVEQMPSFVRDQLAYQNLNSGEQVLKVLEGKGETVAQSIADEVIAPTAKAMLEPVCSLVLFLVLQTVLGWVLTVLNVLAKIPGINQVNKFLGGAVGVVQGVLWAFFAVLVIEIVAANGLIASVTPEAVDSSLLVDWLSSINPMGSTIQDLFVIA